jgi:hypothetical protein
VVLKCGTLLMDNVMEAEEAKRKFDALFGSLAAENGLWDELGAERKWDRARIERKV